MDGPDRKTLIRGLWPDKAMYASILLVLTGALGALAGIVLLSFDIAFSKNVPAFFREYPASVSLALSLAVIVCGLVALKRRSLLWIGAGCVLGIAAQGLLGIGSILSLIAVAFAFLSKLEGEDKNPNTRHLTPRMWPDKSLAASLLLLASGIVTAAWGVGVLLEAVAVDFESLLGIAIVVAGALSLLAAWTVYNQRWPWFAVLAALAGVAGLGVYVVGPLLSLVALVLIALAAKEREFQQAPEPA